MTETRRSMRRIVGSTWICLMVILLGGSVSRGQTLNLGPFSTDGLYEELVAGESYADIIVWTLTGLDVGELVVNGGRITNSLKIGGGGTLPGKVTVKGWGFVWDDQPVPDVTQPLAVGGGGVLGGTDAEGPFEIIVSSASHPQAVIILEVTSLTVEIDIKPGSEDNSVNIDGHGVVPVAVLGSDSFDVSQIDTSTLVFAGLAVRVKGNGNPQCSVQDVNADGFDDLVCQFVDDDPANWVLGEAEATLTGNLLPEFGGTAFEGSDTIRIVPPDAG